MRENIIRKDRVKVSLNIPKNLLYCIDTYCETSGVSRTSALLAFIYLGYVGYSDLVVKPKKKTVNIDKLSESLVRSSKNCGNTINNKDLTYNLSWYMKDDNI